MASTMYDMTRVNANGYFDAEDSEAARYEKKKALNAQRIEDYKNGSRTTTTITRHPEAITPGL